MNENNTIKKMVSGILRGRKNASFDRHIMHPEREWFAVVFIGVGLFAVGIVWNVSMHVQFKNVAISSSPVAEETVVYRASLVESALADFAARKQEYEELKGGLLGNPVVAPVVLEVEPVVTEEPDEEVPEPTPVDESSSTPEESVVLPPSEEGAEAEALLVI